MCNDILKHKNIVRNNIMKSFGVETSEDSLEKSFEDEVNPFEMEAYKSELTKAELDEFEKAKHQDGDMHPNGKWVWRASANGGKGDWRVAKPGGSKATSGGADAKNAATKTSSSKLMAGKDNSKKTPKKPYINTNFNHSDIEAYIIYNDNKYWVRNSDGTYSHASGRGIKKKYDKKYVIEDMIADGWRKTLDGDLIIVATNRDKVKTNIPKGINKNRINNATRSIYGANGYMSKEFLSYLEKNKDKIWPRTDWSSYTNITVHHYGSKDSNYVAITGTNKHGVRVQIDDAYITGAGTNAGSHQVRKNSVIKELTEKYKNGDVSNEETDKNNSKERGVLKKNGNRRHHSDGSVSLSSDKTKNNPYVREKKNWEID